MRYEAYFHPGQEITLRRHFEDDAGTRMEDFLGVLLRRQDDRFEIALGAGEGERGRPGLAAGAALEMLASRYGLGLRLNILASGWKEPGVLEVTAQGELQIFYRRQHLRIDTELWLGLVREGETPSPHQRWQEAMELRAAGRDPAVDATISRRRVNLGAGGLRLPLPAPVARGESCLCLLALDDGQPLITALAEVIWTQPQEEGAEATCGLRFSAIRAEDQRRIDRYVNTLFRTLQSEGESPEAERSFSV